MYCWAGRKSQEWNHSPSAQRTDPGPAPNRAFRDTHDSTQVELVQQMIDGVDKLIKLEESI